MTRDQIAQKVRDNLDDAGITYYSETDVIDSIQDGYDEIAVYCECIEKKTTVSFQSDLTYYDLALFIPDYYRVIRIYSSVTNRFLSVIQTERINSGYRTDWELASGTSSSDFIILGTKYIGISNRLTNIDPQTNKFDIWYKAQAPILGPNDTPKILSQYQTLLEYYSTGDLLEQNQEYVKAETYWGQYNSLLEDYRRKIQLLAKGDRQFVRK